MGLHDIIDMYKPNKGPAFCISMVFFFMYMILQLIDLNTFIRGMDVLDVNKTSRTTIIFSYIVGYFYFFIKLTLQLLTLVILVTIIVWAIIGMTHMLVSSQEGGFSSAAELRGGSANGLGLKMKNSATTVVEYILGVYFLRHFYLIFLVIIPILLIFFVIMFSQFYDKQIIVKRDQDNVVRIMATNHNFMILVITALVVFAITNLAFDYFFEILKEIKLDNAAAE